MSLLSKVSEFARSPKGRRMTNQAKTFASKPENRRKIDQFRRRLTKRG